MTEQSQPESARPVDAIANRYVEECVHRYPELATELGVPGYDDLWDDHSMDGHVERVSHIRRTISALHAASPTDQRETVAKEVMLERLGLEVELFEAHISTSQVSVVDGPAQRIRATFDLMPVDSQDAWANIAGRLRTIDQPLRQTRHRLGTEAVDGNISAVRQVSATVDQIRSWTGEVGDADFFAGLVDEMPADLPDALRRDVSRAADHARSSFAEFGQWLTSDLAPLAPSLDAVGEERYTLDSRNFLGSTVDLAETYAWGWDELARIRSEQRVVARQLTGSDDILGACAALDADADRRIQGAGAFRDWMQQLTDQALEDLAGIHFDIPDPIKVIECCLAPTHDGLIYYTEPAEDFSRPGRMWWAVPEGIDSFSTWKEVTTVYHEGVPGHHLQIAQNLYSADQLNRWQRSMCFVSGHGEGWALYAERLMDDLGYLSDAGDKMGMLDAHAFRAARVVLDIGLHLQLEIPTVNPLGFSPGERWSASLALEFLQAACATDEQTLRFEVDRYLGWPGQAPSYKLGERTWLAARDEVRARKGAAFDLRQFHAEALQLGSMGLDPLRHALAGL